MQLTAFIRKGEGGRTQRLPAWRTLKVAVHLHEVPAERRSALRKLIESSPAVHARLRQVSLTTEQALANLLREDTHATPQNPTPMVVARALGLLARLAYGVPGWPAGGPESLEQTVEGIDASFDAFEAGFSNFALKSR